MPRLETWPYRRQREQLTTPGVDFGGALTVLVEQGRYWLVRKAPGQSWTGRFLPRTYEPGELWLIRIEAVEGAAPGRFSIVRREAPGSSWRAVQRMLTLELSRRGRKEPLPEATAWAIALLPERGAVQVSRNEAGAPVVIFPQEWVPGLIRALRVGADWGNVAGWIEDTADGLKICVAIRQVTELEVAAGDVAELAAALSGALPLALEVNA